MGLPAELRTPAKRPSQAVATLEDVLRVLRRRLFIIVLCTVIAAGGALGLSLSQTPIYSATAELLFRNSQIDQQLFGTGLIQPSADPQREAATNQKLVSLDVVAERTSRALKGEVSVGRVRDSVSVEGGGEADVVSVIASDPKPRLAARIANTFAQQYVLFRQSADRAKFKEAQSLVARELARLPEGSSPERTSLQKRADELKILSSLQTGNAEVVQPAQPPSSPSSPKTKLNVALGGIIGLILGLGLAFVLERLDRRVREPEDVSELYDLPLLSVVPLDASYQDDAPLNAVQREAFSMLRARLRYFNVDRKLRTLLVTSAVSGEGKTTVSWHLAMTAAASGARTILIEADLRRPAIASDRNLPPGPGLVDYLAGAVPLDRAITTVPVPSPDNRTHQRELDVLACGVVPPNPTELLESTRMRALLDQLETTYDLVVVDTAPMTVVADGIPLLQQASGVIVVSMMKRVSFDQISQLRELLERVSAPTLGVIANGHRGRARGYYGAYYGYGAKTNGTGPHDQDPAAAHTSAAHR